MHHWDRWDTLWHWLFLGALALGSGLAILSEEPAAGEKAVTLGVALAFAGWYWLLVVRHRDRWQRLAPMTVYFAGALALFVVLVLREPEYALLVYALIPQAFVIFGPGAGTVAVLALNVVGVLALEGSGELGSDDWGRVAISVALSALLGTFIYGIAGESERRAQLVEETEAARRELAAALEENRRLLARARDAGILEERQRLAREMHDTVAQGLTSIVMQLEAAEAALLDGGAGRAAERVDRARSTARAALDEVRRAVHALRPAPLEAAPLGEALARVVERFGEETGVAAALRVTGTPAVLHPDVELTLLRAVQEGLANVRRHAGAAAVTVTLSYMGDVAAVDVHDDGRGFDPAVPPVASADGGVGLAGLRERAAVLGGTVTVESRPGAGTTLSVSVPALAETPLSGVA